MCKCGHLLLIYLFYTDKENSRARRLRRRCGAFLFTNIIMGPMNLDWGSAGVIFFMSVLF